MSEKITTVSARFSQNDVDIMEEAQKVLGISKTKVLQNALHQFKQNLRVNRTSNLEVAVSAASLKRANRLHEYYGYGTSVPSILSEAVELGLREIRKRMSQDRKEDAELARLDMDARSIEMQQDSLTN
jgi:hypothetical protein